MDHLIIYIDIYYIPGDFFNRNEVIIKHFYDKICILLFLNSNLYFKLYILMQNIFSENVYVQILNTEQTVKFINISNFEEE